MTDWVKVAAKYGFVGIVVILGWLYYRRDDGRLQRGDRRGSTDLLEEPLKAQPKKSKKKGQKTNVSGSSTPIESVPPAKQIESGLKQRKTTDTTSIATSSATDIIPGSNNRLSKESDIGDKEFARQLQKAKEGTSFNNIKKDTKRLRTQKQSKINGSFEDAPSTSSDVTGSVGNESFQSSPDLTPVAPIDNTGVADMLEAAGPAPVALRITEPLNPVKPKQQTAKKEEVAEDKKARQKRQRREREKEAKKELNKEVETQRKVLEEKQRRMAREAEGRPAKNGNGWTYDSGLPANAWTSASPVPAKQEPALNGGLLDTTEESTKLPTIIDNVPALSNGSSNGAHGVVHHDGVNGSSQAKAVNGTSSLTSHYTSLPSEEEQMRMLREEEEWTQVAEPKRGKRKNTNGASASNGVENKKQTQNAPIVSKQSKQTNYFPSEFLPDTPNNEW